MYDLLEKTLYKNKENPLYKEHRFSDVLYNNLLKEITKYKKDNEIMVPETQAILFYLSSNIWHSINKRYKEYEILPDEVYNLLNKANNHSVKISKAVFFHTCLVGERMLKSYLGTLSTDQLNYFESAYGKEFVDYLKIKQCEHPVNGLTINQFLGGVSLVFGVPKIIVWGKPYSMIVKSIHKVANGSYSLYSGADNVWSLCHNGGTIFNKGLGNIFKVSSDYIFNILDVQDSGQIPAWIEKNKNNKYITKEIIELNNLYLKLFKDDVPAFSEDLYNKSYNKRVKAHEAMHKQYRQWWSMFQNGNNNNNNQNNNDPILNSKLINANTKSDNILIDSFTKARLK